MKAYVKMRMGAQCHQITGPSMVDMCVLSTMIQFCDGFSGLIDQTTTALPPGHPLKATVGGPLEAARNVRNGKWGHVPNLKLTDVEAADGIQKLLDCLVSDLGGAESLNNDAAATTAKAELQVYCKDASCSSVAGTCHLAFM